MPRSIKPATPTQQKITPTGSHRPPSAKYVAPIKSGNTERPPASSHLSVDTPKASLHQDLNAAALAQATNRSVIDPTVFKDPKQKYAAILSRGQRILANPDFQKLPEARQRGVMLNYYNRYVKPGYEQTGQKAPDQEVWLSGLRHVNRFRPEDYYEGSFSDNMSHLGMSMWHSLGSLPAGLVMAGSYIAKADALAVLGLSKHFPNVAKDHQWDAEAAIALKRSDQAKRLSEKISHTMDGNINFWLQTHPSSNTMNKAASGLGDIAGQLPLYAALSEADIGIFAGELIGASRAAEGLGILEAASPTTLTAKLAATKTGTFVAKRLTEGTEGYLASILQGDKDNARHNALVFAGFGTVGSSVGGGYKLTRFASNALIKKFSARVASEGGVVLADSLTQEAADQMDREVVGHGAEGEVKVTDTHIHSGDKATPIEPHEKETAITDAINHVHQHDPVTATLVMGEKTSINSVAQAEHGKQYIELSNEQKARVLAKRVQLTRDAIQELPIHEPELAKAEAEKAIKESEADNPRLAQRRAEIEKNLGIKVSDALHDAEVSTVKEQSGVKNSQRATHRTEQVAQQVQARSFPKLIGDIKPRFGFKTSNFKVKFDNAWDKALYTIANPNKKSAAENEILHQLKLQFPGKSESELRSMGQDVRAAVKEQARLQHMTNEEMRSEYLSRPNGGRTRAELDSEKAVPNQELFVGDHPYSADSIFSRSPDAIKDEITIPSVSKVEKARAKSEEPDIRMLGSKEAQATEPDRYVQFKADTLAYFKQKATQSKGDKQLSKFLKQLDPREFAAELKESLGVEKVFEDPDHLLLYANHYRDSLPSAFTAVIRKHLREESPIARGLPNKAIDELSDNLERHMDRLSFTGRLWGGEPFFRTTKVTQWASRTKWQKELHRENAAVEIQQFAKMTEHLKANYPTQVNTALKILIKMQKDRKLVQDAAMDRAATDRIRAYGRTVAEKLDGFAKE